MAQIKKNQLANIVFPMVDGVDFATVESGLTASDFDSKITKKYFGVTHGNSTAFTSGTISKAVTLVRSGIFQQTLKAAETNFDYVMYAFLPSNTSLAQQMLVFQPVDYDDSDIFSQMSDIGSNLLSYLTGMSGMLSDVQSALDSQFLIITSNISDVDSQLLLNASVISDIQSALDSQFTYMSNAVSDMHSDLRSQISGLTVNVTASDMSDIASRVWATAEGTRVDSRILVIQSLVSDVDSQLLLNASMISDVQSALDSQFTYMSNAVSDMHSDLRSQISGLTVNVTASDMSDIASRVWATAEGTRVDSRILVIQSLVSDVDSQLLLNASMISDVQSALDSQFVYMSNAVSDMHSDLRSQISGITASVSASDISDIASRVWSEKFNVYSAVASSFGSMVTQQLQGASNMLSNISALVSDVDSQLLLNASMVSDVYSLLSDHHSDFQSRVNKQVANFSQLSNAHSDLRSLVSGITATVTASDMSDIASRVWATAEGTRVDSRILIIQSLVSDVDSQLLLNASVISDIQSAIDSQFVYMSNAVSDMHSDLRSQISGITASVSASDISDIASRVWSEKYTAHSLASSFGSLFSDVYSRLLLTQSNVSDVQSALDSQFAYMSNAVSDMHSDLRSQISGLTVNVTASDMSDIASRVWATAEGTRVDSRILIIQSLVSDVDSQLNLTASVVSDIQSALDSQFTWTSNFLSDMNSDLASQIAGITASVSASDISDIASAVWADTIGARVDSRILLVQSNVSDIESQLDLTASSVSDIYSLLSDHHSDFQSRVNKQVANNSQLSDLASDLRSYMVGLSGMISDVDSQLLLNASVISDVQSAVGALNDISVADILTTQMTEAYAADGVAPTLAQALMLIQQSVGDFSISGTTLTVKKLDGTTTAATYTLDDASDPTSRTRST